MPTDTPDTDAKPIEDGALIPCRGGPQDGRLYRVSYLMPFLDGGVPPAGVSFGPGGQHVYELDHARRAWVYQGERDAIK